MNTNLKRPTALGFGLLLVALSTACVPLVQNQKQFCWADVKMGRMNCAPIITGQVVPVVRGGNSGFGSGSPSTNAFFPNTPTTGPVTTGGSAASPAGVTTTGSSAAASSAGVAVSNSNGSAAASGAGVVATGNSAAASPAGAVSSSGSSSAAASSAGVTAAN